MGEKRVEIVARLEALTLRGGSHEMLSSVCRAVRPAHHGWTERECEALRHDLIALIGSESDCEPECGPQEGEDEQAPMTDVEAPQIAPERSTCVHRTGATCMLDYMECDGCETRKEAVLSKRLMTLPIDADGVPVAIGDVMEWPNGETFEVVGVGDGTLFYYEDEDDGLAVWTGASTKRHHQPDTWERIIEDARVCLMSDYKTEATPTMRWKSDLADLVARCKALAGDDE